MEDPITSAMDEALALVATLLYDAHAETSSFTIHPSQGPFTVGFHSEENEMWVYSGEGTPLIKVPDEMWMEQFQDDEECELNKIDESTPMFKADASPPASDISEQPAGSNSRQRRKERRSAARAAATTGTPITTQSTGTTGSEPVSIFQQEMDQLAEARDDFCNNPPRFEDLLLKDEGVNITVNTIEYTEATLAKATHEDLAQIKLMNWPAPDPKHSTIYRATISNSEGHVPLKSDSAHSHFDAIVSAFYWIEYSKRGLSDPSLPQPSNDRPYHYKPTDFALYDIDAPKQLRINTTEELVQYLSGLDDEGSSDQGMEGVARSKVNDPEESLKSTSALKSSSYAAPPVNENVPLTNLQRILASAAQPSAGPERNTTGESCLLTAWVDPVPGLLHPTQVLMERAKLIVTLGHKVDTDFELLPMFEEQAKQMKLQPITASGNDSALTRESIMHYCHVPTPWHLKAVKPGATYADGNPIKQPSIYTILRIKSSYSDNTILRYLLPELDVLGISVTLKGVQLPDTQTKSVMFGVHPDSCPAGLGTLLQYCFRFEIAALVREGKLSQIEGGSLELHDLYFKVQGIKALKLDNPKDLAELGIEGIASVWKRAMALETPTNRTEVHNYFLESSLKSGMLREALGDRATVAKIQPPGKGRRTTRRFANSCETSNILRLLYHITTKEGIQLFHSVCPIQMGPDAGSVMVTFYRKPAILELVEKMAQSPVAWLYWWATEVLHISHKCMLLILKGCEMDDVYLIGETDWDNDTWTVTTPFEDAEDEFARRVEEDGLVLDMSALAPPTPPPVFQEPVPTAPPQTGTADSNQQNPLATPAAATEENINSRGYYMSAEHQAAVDGMGIQDDGSFATRATGAASRVSDATKNTSGAHTFRSQTTVDKKRSYRDQCIDNAKRKAEEFAESLRSINPPNLQGPPASKGPATTAPGKTSPANSHEARMGSGAIRVRSQQRAAKWAARVTPTTTHNSYIHPQSTTIPSASANPTRASTTTVQPARIIPDYFKRHQSSSTGSSSILTKERRRIPTIDELRNAGYKEQRSSKVDKAAAKRERFLLATEMVAAQNETRSAATRITDQWSKGAVGFIPEVNKDDRVCRFVFENYNSLSFWHSQHKIHHLNKLLRHFDADCALGVELQVQWDMADTNLRLDKLLMPGQQKRVAVGYNKHEAFSRSQHGGVSLATFDHANSDVYDGILATELQRDEIRMADVCEAVLGHRSPNSHASGSLPITGLFATSDLVSQHVFQSAHGFGLGDHRVFVVDINLTQLLGSEYSQLVRLPGRKLQAKRYRVRKAHNKSLRDNIRRHKLIEKYHELYQSHESMSPQEISMRINQLDREKTELMKCAESKCKKKCAGKLPNSPKVSYWCKRLRLFDRIRKHKISPLKDPRNLYRSCAVLSKDCSEMEVLQPKDYTLAEVEARIIAIKDQLDLLKPITPELRFSYINDKIDEAILDGNIKKAKELANMLDREALRG
eukprot:scaffold46160_cov42-Cyclotella_meneghiniana.AAC.2